MNEIEKIKSEQFIYCKLLTIITNIYHEEMRLSHLYSGENIHLGLEDLIELPKLNTINIIKAQKKICSAMELLNKEFKKLEYSCACGKCLEMLNAGTICSKPYVPTDTYMGRKLLLPNPCKKCFVIHSQYNEPECDTEDECCNKK